MVVLSLVKYLEVCSIVSRVEICALCITSEPTSWDTIARRSIGAK